MRATRHVLALLPLGILLQANSSLGEDWSSSDCLDCHGEPGDEISYVTEEMLNGSVHEGFECLDCHTGVEDLPHDDALPAVACGSCHEEEAAIYTRHGRALVGEDADLPTCGRCHGTHEILSPSDPLSSVSPQRLPDTCGRCHGDADLAKEHDIRLKRPVEVFKTSVHGVFSSDGGDAAASCNDCHSTGGSAHRIYGPGNPQSTVNHFNIPATCGKCHSNIEKEYREGIHGKLAARGEADTPVCTTCHGEHGILRTSDPRARVSPTQVAEATCTPCHESALLNEKYGLPAGRLAKFVDSYHGLKSKAGDTHVANCASCHGGHHILPSSDPRSSIHPSNLRETCGHCHPGISTVLASVSIHGRGEAPRSTWADFFATAYTFLIIGVIGFMLVYTTLDFAKQARGRRERAQVLRMSPSALAQHTLLAVSFLTLVLTGFALRFSDAWIFQVLFGWDGGANLRGTVHRTAAVFLALGCLWHSGYLITAGGRQFLADMMPIKKDLVQLRYMMLYNLGQVQESPRFGRFSYVEKIEYWALIWGCVIMIGTGVFLWFDNWAVQFVPRGFVDVMYVIHFYEALLATLAIGIWHLYATVFSPAVYPGNPAWITGKMPREMYLHEHPADPEADPAA